MPVDWPNGRPEVNKAKSINDMTQIELYQLIERLSKERDAQSLIRELKQYSGEENIKTDNTTPVNQLYHHGIPNQRWGFRRFQNKDGTRTPLGKIREQAQEKEQPKIEPSDDHKQAVADRAKATKGLSNTDLRRLNERLQLEKTYKELTAAEKKKGESFAKGILKDIAKGAITESGKKLLTNLLNTTIADPLSENIKKYMDSKK